MGDLPLSGEARDRLAAKSQSRQPPTPPHEVDEESPLLAGPHDSVESLPIGSS